MLSDKGSSDSSEGSEVLLSGSENQRMFILELVCNKLLTLECVSYKSFYLLSFLHFFYNSYIGKYGRLQVHQLCEGSLSKSSFPSSTRMVEQ